MCLFISKPRSKLVNHIFIAALACAISACGGQGNTESSSSSISSTPAPSSSSSSIPSSSSSVQVSSSSSAVSSSESSSSVSSSSSTPQVASSCAYETGLGQGSGGYKYACVTLQSGAAKCIESTSGNVKTVSINGSPANNIRAITHGAYGGEMCAVTNDGSIYCGRDGSMDSMPYTGGGIDYISTDSNGGNFCAMGDGSRLICGSGSGASEKSVPEALTQMQCFRNGCCGVTVSGGMWCDADKDRTLSRSDQGGKDLVVVSGGDEATCGVFDDGSVKCWGASWNGQIGVGDNSGAPKPGREPINIEGDVVSTALGQHFSCWLTDDGRVYCSGVGTANGAGGGGETPSLIRSGAGTLTGMIDITAGRGFACATNGAGDLYCWGSPSGGTTAQKFDVGGQVRVPSNCR